MKFFLMTLGVLLISASSHAWLEPIQMFGDQGYSTPSPLNCANFTGSWSGSCTINGVPAATYPLWISQNGCASMYVNGSFYAMGGSRTESHRIPNGITATLFTANTDLKWAQGGASLESQTQIQTHDGGKLVYSDQIQMVSSLMSNSHMLTNWTSKYSQGTCTYQRVY